MSRVRVDEGRATPPTAIGVAVIWLLVFTPILFGGMTLASTAHVGDTLVWHQHIARAVAGGHLPEWDSSSGLGAALAGDPSRAALYLPAWLVAAAPAPWSVDFVLLLHIALAGVGVALWARRLGADPAAATAAGGAALTSTAVTSLLVDGGPLYAAAWLPWLAWATDRLAAVAADRGRARALMGPALVVAAFAGLLGLSGATGPALAAPLLVVAVVAARTLRGARAYGAAFLALAGGALLAAFALLPWLFGGGGLAAPAARAFGVTDLPVVAFAAVAVVAPGRARAGTPRRLAAAAMFLLLLSRVTPVGGDGLAVAGFLALCALGGSGLSLALERVLAPETASRWRAVVGAVLVAAVVGPPAVHTWRGLPLAPRAPIEDPPALLAGAVGSTSDIPARVAWADTASHPYRDGPPDTGARFGVAYLPGADRARDPELARLWRASSGAAERLLDLFDVAYVLVPATVAVPAGLPVRGTSERGDWVLAANLQRRPRAFVALRWSWHADAGHLSADLFPAAPDRRASAALAEVRLLGAGTDSPAAPGPAPARPCRIDAPRPEEVTLACSSGTAGYAVLLDRHAAGWTAAVDGEDATIERADLLARAVAIPAGDHEIAFRYRAPGLRLGAALSLLAWVNLAALALVVGRAKRGTRDDNRKT